MTTHALEFKTESFKRAPGLILPQKAGRALWLPMWAMAVMAFAGGFILAIVRASRIADGAAESTILALRHTQAAVMFIGFAAVFAAISFAIARILGVFRTGGGAIQEAVGSDIVALKMPAIAKAFVLTMMMAMMLLIGAVVVHFVVGAGVAAGTTSITSGTDTFDVLEGVRRFGVAMYLGSIALGLGSIITVLRFQTSRIRQLELR